jgi:general secretion pathway protein G
MAMAIVATLLTIAIPAYKNYSDAKDVALAKQEIIEISSAIDRYFASQSRFPDSLADVSMHNKTDPWGNLYIYLNLSDPSLTGNPRKDGKLHPVNSDYDLYSTGKDGLSKPPFNNSKSRDDIVRANNGKFIGLAAEY